MNQEEDKMEGIEAVNMADEEEKINRHKENKGKVIV